jgi:hypothetical protein
MQITEESRQKLYDRLEETPGKKEASTLMEHIPPVGWADVAHRSDIDGLERRFDEVDRRFVELEERMTLRLESAVDRLRTELGREMRAYGLALITVNASITAMAVALTSVL